MKLRLALGRTAALGHHAVSVSLRVGGTTVTRTVTIDVTG